ncbi:MAG: ATP-grasp domain-containing protein [Spirochaetales bacterium]|nr:ATP-grasp domain-containing protein [Spirochaetales bacterium]
MYTIGIAGHYQDKHVTSLVDAVRSLGHKVCVLDFNGFPRYNLLSWGKAMSYDHLLESSGIDLARLDILLIRNIYCGPKIRMNNLAAFQESSTMNYLALRSIQSLIAYLEKRIPVINTLYSAGYHSRKPSQYHLLNRHGISVPETLVANNRNQIKGFLKKHGHRVIVKPQASGAEVVMADDAFFESMGDVLKKRPFIFQQFVQGRSFRAYLLGAEILSVGEIIFNREYVDWRERSEEIRHFEMPTELALELKKAVRLLGLAYCAVDIEYDDATGKFYFLDFNPSGLFTGWSKGVNINMAQCIADYLVKVLEHGKDIWIRGGE